MLREYKYYIAFCYKDFDTGTEFGSVILTSSQQLLLQTERDIEGLKNYVTTMLYEKNNGAEPIGVTILDWRPLKGE